jgi:hypothetical protein
MESRRSSQTVIQPASAIDLGRKSTARGLPGLLLCVTAACSLTTEMLPMQDGAADVAADGPNADQGTYHGFQPKPAGYWSFDLPMDSNGAIGDDLGGGHPVTLYGATVANGQVGEALSFDGTSSYADIPHDPSFEPVTEGSVSMWLFPEELASDKPEAPEQDIFDKSSYTRDWQITSLVDDHVLFSVGEAWQAVSTTTLTLGTWLHVVGTFKQDESVDIFVNGTHEGTIPAGSRHPDSLPIRLGNGNWFDNHGFGGKIDEVAVWEIALTAEQVHGLYVRGLNGQHLTD